MHKGNIKHIKGKQSGTSKKDLFRQHKAVTAKLILGNKVPDRKRETFCKLTDKSYRYRYIYIINTYVL